MAKSKLKAGQLVRLVDIDPSNAYYRNYNVTVYFCSENDQLVPGKLSSESIGLIIRKENGLKGTYRVLFNDRVALITDTYIKLFDPDDPIFNHYDETDYA